MAGEGPGRPGGQIRGDAIHLLRRGDLLGHGSWSFHGMRPIVTMPVLWIPLVSNRMQKEKTDTWSCIGHLTEDRGSTCRRLYDFAPVLRGTVGLPDKAFWLTGTTDG
jgi:hypothetical protein